MPSFFSRVGRAFTTKKLDHGDHHQPPAISIPPPTTEPPVIATASEDARDSPPLGGAYVPVSPTISPSAAAFTQNAQQTKLKEERSLTASLAQLLRSRSPSRVPHTSPIINVRKKRAEDAPHLSLHLEDPVNGLGDNRGSSTLDTVFDSGLARDIEADVILDDKTILERRLSPTESVALLKATSAIVKERGLTTLGLFKPHWHSSNPSSQRAIVSLFLTALANPESIVRPSPQQRFESELQYSQSPHDIAAIFRWAIRHLQLDGGSFGTSAETSSDDQWAWYRNFTDSERAASHPQDAFSTILVPTLPEPHAELLHLVLDLTSAVAANADANAISGSKLSKVLGWWLISARAVPSNPRSWATFYAEWEFAARVLEHLFLAFVRDQGNSLTLPKRLSELVAKYPYAKYAVLEDGGLLARPRFSTRRQDALYIQLKKDRGKRHQTSPSDFLTLIEEAMRCEISEVGEGANSGLAGSLWETLKSAAYAVEQPAPEITSSREEEEGSQDNAKGPQIIVQQILADETIRILTLVSATKTNSARSPSFSTSEFTISNPSAARRRSFSFNDSLPQTPSTEIKPSIDTVLEHTRASTSPAAIPSPPPNTGADWQVFATGGFGELSTSDFTLSSFKNDITPTASSTPTSQPPSAWLTRHMTSRRKRPSQDESPRRASFEGMTPSSTPATPVFEQPQPQPTVISATSIVQIDEAFIDVWADSLLDSVVVKDWPSFIICQLRNPLVKPPASPDGATETIEWLIIEQMFVKPASRQGEDRATSPSQSSFAHTRSPSSIMGKKSRLNSFFQSLKSGSTTASSPVIVNGTGASGLTRTLSDGGRSVGRLTRKLSNRMLGNQAEPQTNEAGELIVPEGTSKELSPVVEKREDGVRSSQSLDEGLRTPTNATSAAAGMAMVVETQQEAQEEDQPGLSTLVPVPERDESSQLSMLEMLETDPPFHPRSESSHTDVASSPISPSVVNAFPDPPSGNLPDNRLHAVTIAETVDTVTTSEIDEAEEVEKAKIAKEEKLRLEEAELQRIEEEKARVESEAAERRAQAEEARIAAEKAEEERMAAVAAAEVERERVRLEGVERERLAVEQAEKERLALEEAEKQRLQVEEEKARLAAEEEQKRLEAERLEQERIEEERLAAEKAAAEAKAAEDARVLEEERQRQIARLREEEEKARQLQLERTRQEQAKLEAEYLAQEAAKAEAARLAEEQRLEAIRVEEAKAAEAKKQEEARLEAERMEQERLAAEAEVARIAEQERMAAEKAEAERLALEKAEQERLATEKAEQERLAAEEVEKQRLAAEQAERDRLVAEQAEHERIAAEEEAKRLADLAEAEAKAEEARVLEKKQEEERLEAERLEAELKERERAEAEAAAEAQRLEDLRVAAEQAEQQRLAAEKVEQERLAAEKAEQERLVAEEAEKQRLAAEQAELDRLTAEQAEHERIAAEEEAKRLADLAEAEAKAEEARVLEEKKREEERLEAERIEAERKELERIEAEAAAEAQRLEDLRIAAERAEQERLAAEKVEQERLAAEKAEADRIAAEKAEQERLALEAAEQERLAAEKAEADRIAAEKAEQERLALESVERQRLAFEQAERDRLAAEQALRERLAAEAEAVHQAAEEERRRQEAEAQRLAEEERLEAKRLEAERIEKERAEAEAAAEARKLEERLAAEEAEKARLQAEAEAEAAAEAGQDRLERERVEQEKIEAARLEAEQIAKEAEEQERLAREKAEAEEAAQQEAERLRLEEEARVAAEKAAEAERERLLREAEEAQRLATEAEAKAVAEKAERERIEAEERAKATEAARLEKERQEAEAAEAQRLAQELTAKAEAERELLKNEAKDKAELEQAAEPQQPQLLEGPASNPSITAQSDEVTAEDPPSTTAQKDSRSASPAP